VGGGDTSEDETKIGSYAIEIQSIPFRLMRRHVSHTAKEVEDKTDCAVILPDFCVTLVMKPTLKSSF
jgi:hypothetical protein